MMSAHADSRARAYFEASLAKAARFFLGRFGLGFWLLALSIALLLPARCEDSNATVVVRYRTTDGARTQALPTFGLFVDPGSLEVFSPMSDEMERLSSANSDSDETFDVTVSGNNATFHSTAQVDALYWRDHKLPDDNIEISAVDVLGIAFVGPGVPIAIGASGIKVIELFDAINKTLDATTDQALRGARIWELDNNTGRIRPTPFTNGWSYFVTTLTAPHSSNFLNQFLFKTLTEFGLGKIIGVFAGYWKIPEASAKRIVADASAGKFADGLTALTLGDGTTSTASNDCGYYIPPAAPVPTVNGQGGSAIIFGTWVTLPCPSQSFTSLQVSSQLIDLQVARGLVPHSLNMTKALGVWSEAGIRNVTVTRPVSDSGVINLTPVTPSSSTANPGNDSSFFSSPSSSSTLKNHDIPKGISSPGFGSFHFY